jgi:hypothetical protein
MPVTWRRWTRACRAAAGDVGVAEVVVAAQADQPRSACPDRVVVGPAFVGLQSAAGGPVLGGAADLAPMPRPAGDHRLGVLPGLLDASHVTGGVGERRPVRARTRRA